LAPGAVVGADNGFAFTGTVKKALLDVSEEAKAPMYLAQQ
jgi:hypothetical protein